MECLHLRKRILKKNILLKNIYIYWMAHVLYAHVNVLVCVCMCVRASIYRYIYIYIYIVSGIIFGSLTVTQLGYTELSIVY